MVGRDWYSRPLATGHFWASVAGVVIATGGLLGAGAAQAGALAATTATGLSAAVKASAELQGLFEIEVVVGAAVFAAAQLAFAFNSYRTSRVGPLVTHVPARAVAERV
jgi:cbb3-type cytochrome oxidase subunit 1